MKRLARRLLPRPVQRLSRSLLWGFRDATGRYGLPPAYLRVKVTGGFDPSGFILGGEIDAQNILVALDRVGVTLAEDATVLDFGCGVGRILAPLHQKMPHAHLFGTDVESDLIRWCRRGLKDVAQFNVNSMAPPLPYRDGQFDLVYSWSVFTHIDEALQFRWLEELRRVARPGAILLLTVHGPGLAHYPPEHEYHRRGFYFDSNDTWRDYFPDFYHGAYHKPAYVQQEWSRYFTVLDYWERGQTGGQDMVILRRE